MSRTLALGWATLEGSRERAGRNEALFREVNENIAKLEERLGSGEGTLPVICECARTDCAEQLEIGLGEYARVREHPDRFILAPGHQAPNAELLVEQHPAYVIVEKHGVAAAAADAVSPD